MAFKVKPTAKQREVLAKLAEPDRIAATCHHSRSLSTSAWISGGGLTMDHIRCDYIDKFMDWGWIECIESRFTGSRYKITDVGREALTLGIRK